METTQINYKTITFFLAFIMMIYFSFKGCNDKSNLQTKNEKYLKSNDSLNVLYQKGVLKIEKNERNIQQLNKDLLVAHNNSQIAETKYYALKITKVQPKYIENLTDCNDTVQKIHSYAVTKDSLCNETIVAKNIEIKNQDSIIVETNQQKSQYIGLLVLEKNAKTNLNIIIDNNNKEIRNEKLKKNIWKLTSVGLAGVILKLIINK